VVVLTHRGGWCSALFCSKQRPGLAEPFALARQACHASTGGMSGLPHLWWWHGRSWAHYAQEMAYIVMIQGSFPHVLQAILD